MTVNADNTKPKYNLSFKRIVTRMFLTGVIGILFGIAMFPFMRTADGLLFEQRAAIGGENMMRAVALWGIYTAIVTILAFWKKRFRMVSVLLIACWFVSITGYLLLAKNNESIKRCERSTPYAVEKEFDRALDLISQRLDVENNRGYGNTRAFDWRNCIEVAYSELNTEVGSEGLFLEEDPNLQHMRILINPSYKTFDDLTISTVLMHELTHVGQYTNKIITNKNDYSEENCYFDEAQAFTGQALYLSQLNKEEVRSIVARINQDSEANPAFAILADVEHVRNDAYQACDKLRIANSLTQIQFNECVWTGTQNKLLEVVKKEPMYQEQCKNNSKVN